MVRYSQPVVLEPPVFPQDPSWPAPPPSPPQAPPAPAPLPLQPVEFKDKAMRIIHEVSRRRQLFNQGTLLQRRE